MLQDLLGIKLKETVVIEPEKHKKLNPFDIINAINAGDKTLINAENEKQYSPYVINKGLSYGVDTVIYANEMNSRPHIPTRLQFDFLINTIRPRKRYNKWLKAETVEALDVIQEYYGYSTEKARQVLPLFSNENINDLKRKLIKGGRNGR